MDNIDELCVGVFSWIGGIEAIDVGQEKQKVRVNHGGCDGAEGIIVAKFNFLKRY